MEETNACQAVLSQKDLEEMVALMLQALPTLECAACCDLGYKYQYVELSAQLFREEWEWACFHFAILEHRQRRSTSG